MHDTIIHAISEFVQYLTFQKRYSSHTVRAYETDLLSFQKYLNTEYETTEFRLITTSMVRSWLAHLKEQNESSVTVNRKISSLKSFFKYLLKKGYVEKSPASAISSLKTPKRLPVYVEEKETGRLFSLEDLGNKNTWKGRMDFLILMLFYHTGIRLSELIYLREENISLASKTLKVDGKGSKQRILPVSDALFEEIRSFLAEKRKLFGPDCQEFLIVNEKGKLLYPRYVYNLVQKYLGEVTTQDKKSPHVLRHTFATHLTNNGAPIRAIKELLGHSSLAATQVYTHNSIEKLKEVHKQAHPRS